MPTKPEGAVGSLDYSQEERTALAIKSRTHPPKFGNADRQRLIDEVWIVMSFYTLIEQQAHIWNHVYR